MTGRHSFSKMQGATERRCDRSALYWVIVICFIILVPVRVSMKLEISTLEGGHNTVWSRDL
jgi:hypothetical protein